MTSGISRWEPSCQSPVRGNSRWETRDNKPWQGKDYGNSRWEPMDSMPSGNSRWEPRDERDEGIPNANPSPAAQPKTILWGRQESRNNGKTKQTNKIAGCHLNTSIENHTPRSDLGQRTAGTTTERTPPLGDSSDVVLRVENHGIHAHTQIQQQMRKTRG